MKALALLLATTAMILSTGCTGGMNSSRPLNISPSTTTTTPGAPTATPAPTPALAVTPASPAIRISGTIAFAANLPVSWTVQEGAAGGTITASGVYTASANPGLYHVVATATGGSSQTAVVPVLVTPTGFMAANDLNERRFAHTATLLNDGRVLIAGGIGYATLNGDFNAEEAELFDPVSGTFSAAGTCNRQYHTATLLESGVVLLAGGEILDTAGAVDTADLYDPTGRGFTPAGRMAVARVQHTATLLRDGRVLIAGGMSWTGSSWASTATAEIYDPASGSFSPTGSMSVGRYGHTATLLPDGRVLITGGTAGGDRQWNDLSSAELYEPVGGQFQSAGTMTEARAAHTATLLQNGEVLLAGGDAAGTAELYSPSGGTFTRAGTMGAPRASHTATLLSNGTVLLAGGGNGSIGGTRSAEIYDPTNSSFTRTADLMHARSSHSATLLGDGTVLIAGGLTVDDRGAWGLSSTEIYK